MATVATQSLFKCFPSAANSNTTAVVDEYAAYEAGVLLNNRYLKLSNIQVGSYGKVSLARDMFTGEDVAVKAMDKNTKGVRAMARHEVSLLKRLSSAPHANICQLLNFFESSTHYFLVFEYCAHGDLYDYLKSRGNHLNPSGANGSPITFKHFVKELASAVKSSHSRGVYHRDIKPENILITSTGSVKLTDWGLATVCSKSFDPCIGTEKYMAPETFFKRSDSVVSKSKPLYSYDSARSDYWSIGITMLYTLFGSCPFKLANVSDVDFKKFVESPTHLFTLYPNLSNHGFHAIMQLLQLNPIHRSLDECLAVLSQDFGAGLTMQQELDQLITGENNNNNNKNNNNKDNNDIDGMVFGLDDMDLNMEINTVQQNIDDLVKDQGQILNSKMGSGVKPIPIPGCNETVPPCDLSHPSTAPPSLVESLYPMGTSWADMEDFDASWDSQSFQIQQIGSFRQNKPVW